jgi:hypothetical protein
VSLLSNQELEKHATATEEAEEDSQSQAKPAKRRGAASLLRKSWSKAKQLFKGLACGCVGGSGAFKGVDAGM